MAKRVTDGFGKAPKILTTIPEKVDLQLEKHEWAVHTTDSDVATSILTHLQDQQLDSNLHSIKHGQRKLSVYMVPREVVKFLKSRKLRKNEASFTAYHRVNREAKWQESEEGKKHVGTLATRGLLTEEDKALFRKKVKAARKAN